MNMHKVKVSLIAKSENMADSESESTSNSDSSSESSSSESGETSDENGLVIDMAHKSSPSEKADDLEDGEILDESDGEILDDSPEKKDKLPTSNNKYTTFSKDNRPKYVSSNQGQQYLSAYAIQNSLKPPFKYNQNSIAGNERHRPIYHQDAHHEMRQRVNFRNVNNVQYYDERQRQYFSNYGNEKQHYDTRYRPKSSNHYNTDRLRALDNPKDEQTYGKSTSYRHRHPKHNSHSDKRRKHNASESTDDSIGHREKRHKRKHKSKSKRSRRTRTRDKLSDGSDEETHSARFNLFMPKSYLPRRKISDIRLQKKSKIKEVMHISSSDGDSDRKTASCTEVLSDRDSSDSDTSKKELPEEDEINKSSEELSPARNIELQSFDGPDLTSIPLPPTDGSLEGGNFTKAASNEDDTSKKIETDKPQAPLQETKIIKRDSDSDDNANKHVPPVNSKKSKKKENQESANDLENQKKKNDLPITDLMAEDNNPWLDNIKAYAQAYAAQQQTTLIATEPWLFDVDERQPHASSSTGGLNPVFQSVSMTNSETQIQISHSNQNCSVTNNATIPLASVTTFDSTMVLESQHAGLYTDSVEVPGQNSDPMNFVKGQMPNHSTHLHGQAGNAEQNVDTHLEHGHGRTISDPNNQCGIMQSLPVPEQSLNMRLNSRSPDQVAGRPMPAMQHPGHMAARPVHGRGLPDHLESRPSLGQNQQLKPPDHNHPDYMEDNCPEHMRHRMMPHQDHMRNSPGHNHPEHWPHRAPGQNNIDHRHGQNYDVQNDQIPDRRMLDHGPRHSNLDAFPDEAHYHGRQAPGNKRTRQHSGSSDYQQRHYGGFKKKDQRRNEHPHCRELNVKESSRRWQHLGPKGASGQEGFNFTVMSYNILAQTLLEEHWYLYERCQKDHLSWPIRRDNIVKQILAHDPDVVCLQEVQQTHWNAELRNIFETNGYNTFYKKRTGDRPDGCAVMYKTDKFTLMHAVSVEMQKGGVLDRDNVGIICLLAPHPHLYSGHVNKLCVATTHLLFNPKRGDVKVAQLALLMAEIDKYAASDEGESEPFREKYCPTILCGDMNSLPFSDCYDFISKGMLRYVGLEKRRMSGQREGLEHSNRSCVPRDLMPPQLGISSHCIYKYVQDERWRRANQRHIIEHGEPIPRRPWTINTGELRHSLALQSVYDHYTDPRHRDIEVTAHHARCTVNVDYIFYSCPGTPGTNPLLLKSRFSLPNAQQAQRFASMPNDIFPSDHFCLVAKFLLK